MEDTRSLFRSLCSCNMRYTEGDYLYFGRMISGATIGSMAGYKALKSLMERKKSAGENYFEVREPKDARQCCLSSLICCVGQVRLPTLESSGYKISYLPMSNIGSLDPNGLVSRDKMVNVKGLRTDSVGNVAFIEVEGNKVPVLDISTFIGGMF